MSKTLAVIGGVVALVAVVVLGILYAAGISIFSSHVNAYVAKKTLAPKITAQVFNPSNAIGSQGYFESMNNDVKGDVAKIVIAKSAFKALATQQNQDNLVGLQNICIKTVTDYNAAAKSISSQAFRSADLPPTLNPHVCN